RTARSRTRRALRPGRTSSAARWPPRPGNHGIEVPPLPLGRAVDEQVEGLPGLLRWRFGVGYGDRDGEVVGRGGVLGLGGGSADNAGRRVDVQPGWKTCGRPVVDVSLLWGVLGRGGLRWCWAAGGRCWCWAAGGRCWCWAAERPPAGGGGLAGGPSGSCGA